MNYSRSITPLLALLMVACGGEADPVIRADPGGDLNRANETEPGDTADAARGEATGTLNGSCTVDMETFEVTCRGDANDYWLFKPSDGGTFRFALTWGTQAPAPIGQGEEGLTEEGEGEGPIGETPPSSDVELDMTVYKNGAPNWAEPSNGGVAVDVALSAGEEATIQVSAPDTEGSTVAYTVSVTKVAALLPETPENPENPENLGGLK